MESGYFFYIISLFFIVLNVEITFSRFHILCYTLYFEYELIW